MFGTGIHHFGCSSQHCVDFTFAAQASQTCYILAFRQQESALIFCRNNEWTHIRSHEIQENKKTRTVVRKVSTLYFLPPRNRLGRVSEARATTSAVRANWSNVRVKPRADFPTRNNDRAKPRPVRASRSVFRKKPRRFRANPSGHFSTPRRHFAEPSVSLFNTRRLL